MTELKDDLLMGAEAIAEHTGLKARQVYYLHEGKQIPTFLMCGRVCLRKSTWHAHIERLERGEAA